VLNVLPKVPLARSARPEVRTPILALPAARAIGELPPEPRALLRRLLLDLSAAAREKAEESRRRRKYVMYSYWMVCAVYARHIAGALRLPGDL